MSLAMLEISAGVTCSLRGSMRVISTDLAIHILPVECSLRVLVITTAGTESLRRILSAACVLSAT